MHNDAKYVCRVCGLRQEEPPWGEDGKSPSYEYCDCCEVEFGYGDASLIGIRRHRTRWLLNNANWFDVNAKPENWDLEKQLQQIPAEYL